MVLLQAFLGSDAVRSTARKGPARTPTPAIKGRGEHEWATSGKEHFERYGDQLFSGDRPLRLLVHATMDATGLQYMRACRRFCEWGRQLELEIYPVPLLDRAVAVYMDLLCYDGDIGPGEGKCLICGLTAMYPALRLPEAARALRAWEGLKPGTQGKPVAVEVLMVLIDQMKSLKNGGVEAADACLLSFDAYLREQDWEQLRVCDVTDSAKGVGDDGVMALHLGVQSRGERVKTGQNQGVVIDFPGTRRMLRERIRRLGRQDRLFAITQAKYRDRWYEAASALGISAQVGRPHNVRHTGPSHDFYAGYRGLDAIKKRGRWACDASITRYSKVHDYVKSVADASGAILERGARLYEQLGPRRVEPV